uniref:Uncharacterized protein n=1 Tax=Ixodes ricinus TaxID=34613 RepID=A0A6B0UMG5_IXORI
MAAVVAAAVLYKLFFCGFVVGLKALFWSTECLCVWMCVCVRVCVLLLVNCVIFFFFHFFFPCVCVGETRGDGLESRFKDLSEGGVRNRDGPPPPPSIFYPPTFLVSKFVGSARSVLGH